MNEMTVLDSLCGPLCLRGVSLKHLFLTRQRMAGITTSAFQLSLQHSSSQLHALPRAQPRPRDSTPLAAGGAEVSLRLPDGDSQPVATQGGAVEPTPPPQKSARRSHVKIMSSTVSRFSQASHSYVLTPVPDGAVPRHACATPPAMHTVQSQPPKFFQKHEGAAPDLVLLPRRSGCKSRLRLIDHERVSPRQIQLKAQPPWRVGAHAQCHHGC